jgi:hypothetical protein
MMCALVRPEAVQLTEPYRLTFAAAAASSRPILHKSRFHAVCCATDASAQASVAEQGAAV